MIVLRCPNCGPRNVSEFRFGGARRPRPGPAVTDVEWADYLFLRDNPAGVQTEWWYHGSGCGLWFLAIRDTRTNAVESTHRWSPAEPGTEPDAA